MTVAECPRCHRSLPADAPAGLCASCLLAASSETMVSDSIDSMATMSASGSLDAMATMSSAASSVPAASAPALEPGIEWGPYRIGRLLGRGGMGEVYEAEHLTSGRRVALKVLRNRLQTQDERARFLREGQLAASVSHPHTVYIFGSEELDGTPVISMELLAGGTLKDRVTAHGPMSPESAVAAVLDVIGGLDAAAAVGILHRDIKPSNCFVDRDGVVKVGDFGLSISTLARDVHQQLMTSGFEGTPQFAPPEQLRGEPLDVRADIYAVGATLYYLLTGRAPFDAPDLRQLFVKVTGESPVPPRQLRREIPARLSAVVMQCLAKSPAERPASYTALAAALRPLLARDDKPAAFATRLLAALIDTWIVVGVPVAIATALIADPLTGSPAATAGLTRWSWVVAFVYYLALEGTTAASFGKRLFGFRVVSDGGSPATWPQIVIRTAMFYSPSVFVALASVAGVLPERIPEQPSGWSINIPQSLPVLLSTALFFATARFGNGWRGLHEVLSGTRVVARHLVAERHSRIATSMQVATTPSQSAHRYGPFIALDADDRRPGGVVRAFDPVLRRQVWLAIAEASTPPIDSGRRDLARPGRLHWLTGRRSADENWDAYEAPDGRPWTDAVAETPWSQTKLQLLDLANELETAAGDGTEPPLALDRVWVRDNGRIVLLDFSPPGSAARATTELSSRELLQAATNRVPRNPTLPGSLPLSARLFLERWTRPSLPTLADARAALLAMTTTPDRVHWWRRSLPGALAATPIVIMLLVGFVTIPALGRFTSSDTSRMMNLLGALKSRTLPADNALWRPEVRNAAEVAIAGQYGHLIRDDSFWETGVVRSLAPDYRAQAEDIVKRHPSVSPDELREAEAILSAARQEGAGNRRPQQGALELGGIIISTVTAGALALVLVACLISSLLVPGGLVARQLGLATVTRSGREISRGHSLLRTLVAGLPAIVWLVYLAMAPKVQGWVPTPPRPITGTLVVVGVLGLGLVWTIARRARGPHDLLMGTWVVPR